MRVDLFYKLVLQVFPVFRFQTSGAGHRTIDSLFDAVGAGLRGHLKTMPRAYAVLAKALWPPLAVLTGLWFLGLNGRLVKRRTGVGLIAQFAQQMRLAFRDGVLPAHYYMYEFFDPAKRAGARDYLPRFLLKPFGLYAMVHERYPEANRSLVLSDKRLFHDMCVRCGLPTPPIIAEVSNGSVSWEGTDCMRLPAFDLFVKPRKGRGGRGAEMWSWVDGTYASVNGERLDAEHLIEHLCAKSLVKDEFGKSPESWLAMQRLVNHPDLLNLTTGALNTLRIVTCRNESGVPEHMVTIFRMARDPSKVIDNCHAGGLAALVDPATGVLGKATDDGSAVRLGWLDRHPATGAQIEGRAVPFWREALSLVFSAHECLGDMPLVGWDVAILATGPCLIEGNKKPCVEIEQRVGGPLGNGRFGELLAYHLSADDAELRHAA